MTSLPRRATLILVGMLLGVCWPATAADKTPRPVKTSVFSRADPDYKRIPRKDGTFEREYYAISNGGPFGGTVQDEALAQVPFPTVAGVVAEHLAAQNYFLAPDSKSATLLLAIYWGRTIPANDINYSSQVNVAGAALSRAQNASRALDSGAPLAGDALAAAELEQDLAEAEFESEMNAIAMENRVRDRIDAANARLLGYIDDLNESDTISRWAGSPRYDELRGEIGDSRYYIVVMAYDFKRLVEKQERKLLWVTRMSISVRGHSFQKHLNEMVARAGRYFGRNSRGLVREFEGTVELGETEVLGYVEDPDSAPAEEKTEK